MRSVANSLTESYPADATSVAQARHSLSDFAAAAGADEHQIEAVRLASSEALTNAVLHAYRGEGGRIHITAAVVEDELWVLIADLSDHLAIAPRANGGTEVRMRFSLVGSQQALTSETRGHACQGRRTRSAIRGSA
jgi:anti-sigma regulatory factor (Ser/Thr protein kinase)